MNDVSKVDLAVEALNKLGKIPVCTHCKNGEWASSLSDLGFA